MRRPDFNSVDHLATWLLSHARFPMRPPREEIRRLAKLLGANRIVLEDLIHEDGRLEVRGEEIVIVLSHAAPETRRNFTLAHEIAHLALAQPSLRLATLPQRLGIDNEERFCDQLAAALLMPTPWILRHYADRAATLFNLRSCAREAGTSLSATSIRLASVVGWRRTLLRWRRRAETWCLVSTAGQRTIRGTTLQSSAATSSVINEVGELCSGYRKTWLPLDMQGRPAAVQAEINVSGSTGIAFVNTGEIRWIGRGAARERSAAVPMNPITGTSNRDRRRSYHKPLGGERHIAAFRQNQ